MPELPELQALAEGLDAALAGAEVQRAVAWSPANLRTASPPLETLAGRHITGVGRRGKVMVVRLDGDLAVAIHLMSAGRLGITTPPKARPVRSAGFGLILTDGRELRLRELSTKRRASAHVVDAEGLRTLPMLANLGPEPVGLSAQEWRERLTAPPGVLHNAMREGRRVAGVGRCYASEIMWAARLAPLARTDRLDDAAWERLAHAADVVLEGATERARERITTNLPDKEKRLTMVHGHYGEACVRCGTTLARVGFSEYELVYCPACQTGGRRYADRRMDRLLR
ncbi:MAG: DNA-formamidopyrimidine glycosylase family protein [Thermoleophilia bacterium]